MLLNIDRVLAMLAEGKDAAKISKASGVSEDDVITYINEARDIIAKYDPDRSRRKIVIKKRPKDDLSYDDLLDGADLSAVPLEGHLIISTAVSRKPQSFSAGILIHDTSDRMLGKIHYNFSDKNEKDALLKTVIRACRIAEFYKTKTLRIMIDNSPVLRAINGMDKNVDLSTKELVDELNSISGIFPDFRVDLISVQANEKARYLSAKRINRTRQFSDNGY